MDQLANYRDSPPINFPVVEVGAMSAEHGVVDIVGCKGQTEADNGLSGGYQVEHTQGAGERKHMDARWVNFTVTLTKNVHS